MSEFPPASLRPLIQEVFDLLRQRKETVSVAETVLPCYPQYTSPLYKLRTKHQPVYIYRPQEASPPPVSSPARAPPPSTKGD